MKKGKVHENKIPPNIVTTQGIVIKVFNKQVELLVDHITTSCLLPNSLMKQKDSIVVGDQAEIVLIGPGQYKLLRILPRKTAFYRENRRSNGEEIIIASNVQMVLAIVTTDYMLHQVGYLEQAIIAAKRASLEVGVYISKWDNVSEHVQAILTGKMSLYQEIADFVFAGTPNNISSDLLKAIEGKSTVVVGDRACGKTTLIDRILDKLNSNEIPNSTPSSTHASILYTAENSTVLIDTPGFRDFALQITDEELQTVFPEIHIHAQNCSFRNCTHTHEDGCEVIEAVRANSISRERFDAYQKMAGAVSITQPKIDYRHTACTESFICKVCGAQVVPEGAGSRHRNHCPHCLSSIHVDNKTGDRASICHGIMDPVSVWVRKDGEWAIIHKCRLCGTLSSNRIAADDNPMLLMSIAVKPLSAPPFPLTQLEDITK